ncbi:hypothetical protein IAU60_005451 [Kwoniella sp. DSM 27419]
MFGTLALTAAALAPLAMALPTKRSSTLSCVQYQFSGPFAAFGERGLIHFYSNVTQFDPDTQTTAFNETRLGLSDDGTIEDCGECRTTELFGFEVCQNEQRYGYNGLENSATSIYGHVVYTNVSPNYQCVTASDPSNLEGSSLKLADCQYDYDTAGSSGQYWQLTSSDGDFVALLINDNNDGPYGPNPQLNDDQPLVLYDVIGANKTFTYFGFKAPEF